MPEYTRIAEFEVDEEALDAMVQQISSADGPPEGLEITRLTILTDRAEGRVVVATRFPSEEAMRAGSAILDGMSPPEVGNRRRVSVSVLEVAYDVEV
jgi:hypothetical protein